MTECLREPASELNVLSSDVIGAAIEVHRTLGPGLLESAYLECLCAELQLRRVEYQREVAVPLRYKGRLLECGYRIDLIVGGRLVVELKTVDKIMPIHQAQMLTYLRLKRLQLGLLINFNTATLHSGLRRVVNAV
jgi:GxxExxY protein